MSDHYKKKDILYLQRRAAIYGAGFSTIKDFSEKMEMSETGIRRCLSHGFSLKQAIKFHVLTKYESIENLLSKKDKHEFDEWNSKIK